MASRSDGPEGDALARARRHTEQALIQAAQVAIAQISERVETSNHVEAAERELRSALAQFVLAEREREQRPAPRLRVGGAVEPGHDGHPAPLDGRPARKLLPDPGSARSPE